MEAEGPPQVQGAEDRAAPCCTELRLRRGAEEAAQDRCQGHPEGRHWRRGRLDADRLRKEEAVISFVLPQEPLTFLDKRFNLINRDPFKRILYYLFITSDYNFL